MNLKSWREVMRPREDVVSGKSSMANFAADLTQVVRHEAPPQYQDPSVFFRYTYITEGTKQLLLNVANRISGHGGDPVIQLQTGFGGGKTHTMLAVYHMAKGQVPSNMLIGVDEIMKEAHLGTLPSCNIAVLDGIAMGPEDLKEVRLPNGENLQVKTMWGILGAALGGHEGYEMVANADEAGVSPGKETLIGLLDRFSPCVILIDELVAYVRQFYGDKQLLGGTFAANLSFVQALTEAVKCVDTAIVLASLPESMREAGDEVGFRALEALSHHFGRVQALWKPVGREESFEIVRRRLFEDPEDPLLRERVVDAFCEMYRTRGDFFPSEAQEGGYREKMLRSYPVHPEIFEQLYTHWSTLERFQRTRGVLKMMSNAIHYLWMNDIKEPLIMPGSLPLCDGPTQGIFTEALNNTGWINIIATDIDGDKSVTVQQDLNNSRYGALSASKRVGRTVFLSTAPGTTTEIHRGLDKKRLLLGTAIPGEAESTYRDALRDLAKRSHYLYLGEDDSSWYHIVPNLTSEMMSRREKMISAKLANEVIKSMLQNELAPSTLMGAVHVFTDPADIPDDDTLRLVVLPLDQCWARESNTAGKHIAKTILERRGNAQRINRNRLLFLACDAATSKRIQDDAGTYLAWKSIVDDTNAGKLNIDMNSLKEANRKLAELNKSLRILVSDSYIRLMAPYCTTGFNDLDWEDIKLPMVRNPLGQRLDKQLEEDDTVITLWAPFHLGQELNKLFWSNDKVSCLAKDYWRLSCCEMYCPRLLNSRVLADTLSDGSKIRDFFALAQGQNDEGNYIGFIFGQGTHAVIDDGLLILSPEEAQRYEQSLKPGVDKKKLLDNILFLARGEWSSNNPVYPISKAIQLLTQLDDSLTEKDIFEVIVEGVSSRQFGLADNYAEGKFDNLAFQTTEQIPLNNMFLVNPSAVPSKPNLTDPPKQEVSVTKPKNKTFMCTFDLSQISAKTDAMDALEAIATILRDTSVKVTLQLDIHAHTENGFTESQERALKENLPSIGCTNGEFQKD